MNHSFKAVVSLGLILTTITTTVIAQATGEDVGRPKVGLVLGGGGAMGFSHIGVLKVLEEMRIPIDYIGGTSMGSIIAGLYASGASPEEIEQFLAGLDWNEVMSDETPRRELAFRRKQDDQRYLFELGLNLNGPKFSTGMAAGQKFNNLMQYMTLRSVSITNYDELPVPFRAVATDLESGLPYVMTSGNLATSMRASMAVPGAFTPVEIDGHLLVDGGIVDNLPVDTVRAMGADIIIAVDVGAHADKADMSKMNSMLGIAGRTYSIAQRPGQVEAFKRAEIGIQPELAGMNAAQFGRVVEFVPRGYAAGLLHSNELVKLQVDEAAYAAFLARQRRPMPESILVTDINVTGSERVSEAIVRGRIQSQTNAPFNPKQVGRDLLHVYGIGEFEQVMFRLKPGTNGSASAEYALKERPWGPLYLKYGLKLESDFEDDANWAMLINLTRMSINRLGGEWVNELELGNEHNIRSEFYQPLTPRGHLFVAPNAEYGSRIQSVYVDDHRVADYRIRTWQGGLDVGGQIHHYGEIRVGPMWGHGRFSVETGSEDLPEAEGDIAGLSASLIVDRQDRTLFARKGYYIKVEGLVTDEGMGADDEFERIEGQAKQQLSFGSHTITLGAIGGSGAGGELPPYAQFALGGPDVFAGLVEDQFRGNYMGVASIGYRYRIKELPSQLGKALYTLVRFDAGNVWDEEFDWDDKRYGGACGFGVDSTLGPIYLVYGRADEDYDRFYFSLGTAF